MGKVEECYRDLIDLIKQGVTPEQIAEKTGLPLVYTRAIVDLCTETEMKNDPLR